MNGFQKIAFLLTINTLFYSPARAEYFRAVIGHIPGRAVSHALHLGHKNTTERMQLVVSLKCPHEADLADFIHRVNDPADPLYHHFLTPEAFVQKFAPSQEDVNQTVDYLKSMGLRVVNVDSNHLLIDVEGAVSTVQDAFAVQEDEYLTQDGRIAHAPTTEPIISSEIVSKINSVVGLSSFSFKKPHKVMSKAIPRTEHANVNLNPYMTPAKTKSVYNLTSLTQTGAGETLALFELDGYAPGDVSSYASYFSLTNPTLTNVLVDGVTNTPGDNAAEVTLDIELAAAIAPGLSGILVYEGPNTSTGVLHTYAKIANDNIANEVSTSWGESESEMSSGDMNSENIIFAQMAAQGQSLFAASGDSGAYDDSPNGDNTNLEVDDPGSQPNVTDVGGTLVHLNGSNVWTSETSWAATASSGGAYNNGSNVNYVAAEGGGGGNSRVWANTSATYQSGLNTAGNHGSATKRMLPDVSLNADPSNPYPVYVGGSWLLAGGTSCAAPMWAAYTALVNQKRVSNGSTRLGFMNTALYAIAQGANYSTSFHDINDGSTNLSFPATAGYDLTTGWGSFNGAGLFTQLVAWGAASAPYEPGNFLLTPGTLSIEASWASSPSAASYTLMRSTTSSSTGFSSVYTGAGTSYTDAGLTYGTTYYYYVTATNGTGTSSPTATAPANPNPPAPTAPSNLTVGLAP